MGFVTFVSIKLMHHTSPVYLTELFVPVSTHQGQANLHSTAHGDFSVATNKSTTYGHHSFSVSCPTTRKMLSLLTCEQSLSLGRIHSLLKIELFNRAYIVAWLSKQGACITVPTINRALYKCTDFLTMVNVRPHHYALRSNITEANKILFSVTLPRKVRVEGRKFIIFYYFLCQLELTNLLIMPQ